MQIEYDPEADAISIRFRDVKPSTARDVEAGLTVDLDEHRHVIGIELLDVSHRFSPHDVSTITFKNVLLPAS